MLSRKPIIGFRVEVCVEPDNEGFYAYCPALKGLHTCGSTEEEALQNAKNAAMLYIQSLIKHGDPIPVGIAVCKEVGDVEHPSAGSSRHTEDLRVPCAI